MDERLTSLNGRRLAPGQAVVYWMQRSQRSSSNLALSEAIERANDLRQPVVCYFGLDESYPQTTARDYRFMLEGLQDVAHGLRTRNVGFVTRRERNVQAIARLARELKVSLVEARPSSSSNLVDGLKRWTFRGMHSKRRAFLGGPRSLGL